MARMHEPLSDMTLPDPADPTIMAPEERIDELAAIFARAILRLPRQLGADLGSFPPDRLAIPAHLRPHRAAG